MATEQPKASSSTAMEVDDVPVPTAAPADFMPDDDDPWFGKQTWLPAEDRLSEIQSDERQRFERFYPGFQRPLMARPRGMMLLPRMADIGFSGNFMGRDDRSRSSRNLVSRILDDTVRIVSRASGVAIYCCAVWDDMEQGTEAYETSSLNLHEVLRSGSTESLRHRVMQLVHAELGPTMGRELKNTFPTVYGKPDFDFKPWMPPQHPINSQEAFMAVTYCDLLAAWQGLVTPINWELLGEDFSSGRNLCVSRNRIPIALDRLDHPWNWSKKNVAVFNAYIRLGQRRLQDNDTTFFPHIFQFVEGGRPDDLRTRVSEGSKLTYNQESAMYLKASSTFDFPANVYLPSHVPTSMISPEAAKELRLASAQHRLIPECVRMIDEYAGMSPPTDVPQGDQPRLHAMQTVGYSTLAGILKDPVLPEAFYNWRHDDHKHFQVTEYVVWVVDKGSLIHESGKIFGGWEGAIRPLVAVVRIFATVAYVRSGKVKGTNIKKFADHELDSVNELLEYLATQLKHALDESVPAPRPQLPPGVRVTPWTPRQIRWSNATGNSGVDDPDVVASVSDSAARGWPLHADSSVAVADDLSSELIVLEDKDLVPRTIAAVPRPSAFQVTPRLLPTSVLSDPRLGRSSSGRPVTTQIPSVSLPPSDESAESARRSLSEPYDASKQETAISSASNALRLEITPPNTGTSSPIDLPDLSGDVIMSFAGHSESTPQQPRGRVPAKTLLTKGQLAGKIIGLGHASGSQLPAPISPATLQLPSSSAVLNPFPVLSNVSVDLSNNDNPFAGLNSMISAHDSTIRTQNSVQMDPDSTHKSQKSKQMDCVEITTPRRSGRVSSAGPTGRSASKGKERETTVATSSTAAPPSAEAPHKTLQPSDRSDLLSLASRTASAAQQRVAPAGATIAARAGPHRVVKKMKSRRGKSHESEGSAKSRSQSSGAR